MNDLRKGIIVVLGVIFILFSVQPAFSYDPKFFTPYKPTVKGFENRLSLKNILDLTSMPSSEARQLLLKAGYSKYEDTESLVKSDHYAHYNNITLYMVNFWKDKNSIGFRNIIIFTQPEMQFIQAEFLADGYSETRVIPRKGARWTKVYTKSGFPTYSISMLLFQDMNKRALVYDYDHYWYCLICEKR